MKIKLRKGYSNQVPKPGSIGAWNFIAFVYTEEGKTLWLCRCKCGLEKLCEPHSLNKNSMCKSCSDINRAGKPRKPRKPAVPKGIVITKDMDPVIPASVEREAAQKTLSFISTGTEDSPFQETPKKEAPRQEEKYPKCTMVPCACGNPLSFTVKYEPEKENPKPVPQHPGVVIPKTVEVTGRIAPVFVNGKIINMEQILAYAKTSKKV